MRIIAGKYRSRKINSIIDREDSRKENSRKGNSSKGNSSMDSSSKGNFRKGNFRNANFSGYRPTTGRARETLFNILSNLIDFEAAVCLDLFAGSGAVGFELLSRGAESCDFVENSFKQAECIQKTAVELSCEERICIYEENVTAFLKRNHDKFYDIIFADPPYDYEHYNELVMAIRDLKFSIFVLEHSVESAGMIQMNDYDIIHKKTGLTNFTILNSKE